MQRYTIFFITVNALHVSGGFSAHHQEFKTVHTESGICQACLLLPLALYISEAPSHERQIKKNTVESQLSVVCCKLQRMKQCCLSRTELNLYMYKAVPSAVSGREA
jgi:hypothetical protein